MKKKPVLKSFLYFKRELARPENQKLFILFLTKKAKFSKLKYFFYNLEFSGIFSHSIFFSILNKLVVFHLLRDFCNIHDHIVAFFIFHELFLQSFFIFSIIFSS